MLAKTHQKKDKIAASRQILMEKKFNPSVYNQIWLHQKPYTDFTIWKAGFLQKQKGEKIW